MEHEEGTFLWGGDPNFSHVHVSLVFHVHLYRNTSKSTAPRSVVTLAMTTTGHQLWRVFVRDQKAYRRPDAQPWCRTHNDDASFRSGVADHADGRDAALF